MLESAQFLSFTKMDSQAFLVVQLSFDLVGPLTLILVRMAYLNLRSYFLVF